MCLKGRNIQKAMFYWNAKVTKCRYQKHFPNYLTLHYKTLFLMDDFLKICIFVNKICMAMNLWELNHTKWWKLTTSFNDLEEVHKEIKKKKKIFMIHYVLHKWKQFRRQFLPLLWHHFVSLFFCSVFFFVFFLLLK